ncbi:MAG: rhomboid family intramembrane serine protease [Chloroflexota bacterium]
MFPLRDTTRSRSFPWVNWALILVTTLVFLFETSLSPSAAERLLFNYGLIPARLSLLNPLPWATLLSSVFLHGGWFHLISNMWMLYIFGDNVEDRMGSGLYLVFYLAAGIVAGLAQAFFSPTSSVPTVGASGAIAGVLGAYFVLFPRGRVLTFVPLFFVPWLVEIPAYIFLGIWFFSQLSSGLLAFGAAASFSGIAWWAHIGGFAFGLLLALPFKRPRRPEVVGHPDEHWPW